LCAAFMSVAASGRALWNKSEATRGSVFLWALNLMVWGHF